MTPPADPDARPPSADTMRVLAQLADVARMERTRLADALHDDALQLMAIARQDLLEWMEDTPARRAIELRLDEMLGALRGLIASMDEPTLDELPLGASVERLAAAVAGRGRFGVTVRTIGDVEGIHDAALRGWARELMANAAKHATPTAVDVRITATPATVAVEVRDDGPGFDHEAARRAEDDGHVGLRRLGRAAHLLGGDLTIRREHDETVVRVRIPRAALVAQRRMEEELGGERRWSAGLVAALQDALMVVREGQVVHVNDALVRMTGFARPELVGAVAPDLPFWAPEHRVDHARRLAQVLARAGGQATLRMTRADGSAFTAAWSIQRVDDGLGGDAGALVIVRDLTEQERALDRTRLRTELQTTIETTRRLARVLDAARRGPAPMHAALGELLIDHLGWQDVVLNVRHGEQWVVAWTAPGATEVLLGERYAADAFDALLDPCFDRGGVFYSLEEDEVEIGDLVVVEAAEATGGPDGVRPGDTLMMPVDDADGRPRAIVSVDRPRSGLRATPTELQALAAIASHVGLAFELAEGRGEGDRR